MAKDKPNVALLIETSNSYSRGVLGGIYAYIQENESWLTILRESSRGDVPHWLASWNGDGIIARIENEKIAKIISVKNIPTVDVSAEQLVPNIPWVETDNKHIIDIVIDHFVSRGYKQFGFFGAPFSWSENRRKYFEESLKKKGITCCSYVSGRNLSWKDERLKTQKWIKSLPKPIALMAAYDIAGQKLIENCNECDFKIPDDVAVVAVDNDKDICNFCNPHLSSVVPDTFKTGYLAASLLSKLMAGEKVEPSLYPIEAIGLEVRKSSDSFVVDDPHVRQALQYIYENACKGINVNDVLARVPLSRRAFENRFKISLLYTCEILQNV